uniref:Uncharacterized protein n=1 Tax=Phytophthora ramorum TaxID=164328 RepID=H3H0H1_PHYRM
MATTGPLPAPYDDGSSTESEYYFDPEEEEAPYEHEPQVKQEPLTVQENTAIKQEYTNERTLQEGAEEIQPPKGSEWSHGAAVVCDNAVERALAMASRFERAMSRTQREEELTADTMHSNERSTSPLKSSEEGAKTANLKKKKKVKVKSKMVSLKSVKATTPTVAAMKPVVVGLRRPPSIVTGAPIELEKGLSVPRSSSRKSPANQSSTHRAEKIPISAKNGAGEAVFESTIGAEQVTAKFWQKAQQIAITSPTYGTEQLTTEGLF